MRRENSKELGTAVAAKFFPRLAEKLTADLVSSLVHSGASECSVLTAGLVHVFGQLRGDVGEMIADLVQRQIEIFLAQCLCSDASVFSVLAANVGRLSGQYSRAVLRDEQADTTAEVVQHLLAGLSADRVSSNAFAVASLGFTRIELRGQEYISKRVVGWEIKGGAAYEPGSKTILQRSDLIAHRLLALEQHR